MSPEDKLIRLIWNIVLGGIEDPSVRLGRLIRIRELIRSHDPDIYNTLEKLML